MSVKLPSHGTGRCRLYLASPSLYFDANFIARSHTISLATNDPGDGGFQLYSKAKAGKAAVLPDSISFAEGSVIPLALDTAAVGLLTDTSEGGLGLSYPSFEPAATDKTIFVWGGSSSVGTLVTQLAVASGARVVTTASQHNFDFCKKNGASEVSRSDRQVFDSKDCLLTNSVRSSTIKRQMLWINASPLYKG